MNTRKNAYALPDDNLIGYYGKLGFSRLPAEQESFVYSHVKPKYDDGCNLHVPTSLTMGLRIQSGGLAHIVGKYWCKYRPDLFWQKV